MTQQFMQMLAALQEQTKASFWRSDVLRPLHILFLALATVAIGLTYAKAPEPIIYGIAALLGVVALTEIGGFIYCLLRDPDLLRSERIRMHKMAIEARLLGDETTGLMELQNENIPQAKILPSPNTTELQPISAGTKPRSRRKPSTEEPVAR